MKLGVSPDNLMERMALLTGILPVGIFESWFGFMLARTIMVATKLDVFEALANEPLTVAEIAKRCGTHLGGTEKLLNALVGLECLRVKRERYALRRSLRAWILKDGKYSFRGQIMLHFQEWSWWEHCEEYVRTAAPLRVHDSMSDEDWGVYQRGMRSGVEMPAHQIAKHLSLPQTAQQMLDIGGSHGYFSVAICRRHPQLRSTILDLPQAIKYAAPLLAKEGMGDRIVHRPGNVLTDDLGTGKYDVVLLASVVHHFDEATNRDLIVRISRALRPGGVVAIWEPMRQDRGGKIRQLGGLMDLFFGFFSKAGTWSSAEVAEWFRGAGLQGKKAWSPRMMPDLALHVGQKPA